MSTQQPNSACLVSVGPSTADILRRQTLVVLEANHYYFEELLEFGPEAQYALSVIYRDAFAVLDAIGWCRSVDPPATVDVLFTAGFVEQLRDRCYDLAHTNIDRVRDGMPCDDESQQQIDATRIAIDGLSQLLGRCGRQNWIGPMAHSR